MCGIVDDIVDGAEKVGGAIVDGAKAVGGAAVDAAKAVGGAVVDGAEAVAHAAEAAAKAAAHAAEAAARTAASVEHAVANAASDVATTVAHGFESAIHDIGGFVSDHSKEIITGLETAGTAVLAATGVGAPLAAVIQVGITSGAEIAQGKGVGTAILDGVSAGADKLVPGAGTATHAVVTGIENGDSLGKIVHDAGLEGLGPNGGPLIGAAGTLSHGIAHGDSAGRVLLDLGSQYAGNASGAGSDHGSVLGQLGIIAVNDAVDGKSLGQFGLDVAKGYIDQAAGGYGSPTAQAANTILDGIGQGKGFGDILGDVYHQAAGEAGRVDAAVPGSVNATVSGSGIFGAPYLGTVAGDLADGKSAGDIGKDLGKQAAGDLYHMVDGTKSDPSNSVGDVLKGAANSLGHVFDGGQTGSDGGTHPPADPVGHSQSGLTAAGDGAASAGSDAAPHLLIGEIQAVSAQDALGQIASTAGSAHIHLGDLLGATGPAPDTGVNTLDHPAPAGLGETIGHLVDQVGIVGPHAPDGDLSDAVAAALQQPQQSLVGTVDAPTAGGDAHSGGQATVDWAEALKEAGAAGEIAHALPLYVGTSDAHSDGQATVDWAEALKEAGADGEIAHALPLHVGTSDASDAPNHPMDVLATSAGIAIGAQGDDPSGSAAQDEGHGTAGSGTAIDVSSVHAAEGDASPAGIIIVGGTPPHVASDPVNQTDQGSGHGGGFWDMAAEASGLSGHGAIASDGGLSHLAHAFAAPASEASFSMASLGDDMHGAASHAASVTAALGDVGHFDIGALVSHDLGHHASADLAHFHV